VSGMQNIKQIVGNRYEIPRFVKKCMFDTILAAA
jgi:hypothetical protein